MIWNAQIPIRKTTAAAIIVTAALVLSSATYSSVPAQAGPAAASGRTAFLASHLEVLAKNRGGIVATNVTRGATVRCNNAEGRGTLGRGVGLPRDRLATITTMRLGEGNPGKCEGPNSSQVQLEVTSLPLYANLKTVDTTTAVSTGAFSADRGFTARLTESLGCEATVGGAAGQDALGFSYRHRTGLLILKDLGKLKITTINSRCPTTLLQVGDQIVLTGSLQISLVRNTASS